MPWSLHELEEELNEPGLQRPLELVMGKAKELGLTEWPLALLTMKPAESEPFFDAMRVCMVQSCRSRLLRVVAHVLPAARVVMPGAGLGDIASVAKCLSFAYTEASAESIATQTRVFGTVEDSLTAVYAFKERFGNRRC